ncbi:GNAT family N-acetyltransferase [Pseudomonas japonica]|uniref:GNAT family N-acetyltransferase n=1 Tax=Pseudomonas japonica TaxID=256466 RepID=UPI0015E460E5|nr:GNAT family N-acetyltransferase [Pseudomonas japonica]MBA1290311.1 GNAT family N-acetyltransferase [Pseudomonas japonica]
MTQPHTRLTYRQPITADLPRLFAIYSDPRTQVFNPAGAFTDPGQAEQLLSTWLGHWAANGFGWWAVAEQGAPEHIIGFGGVAWHSYLGEQRLNLGYRFAVEAWGQGYATELAQAALRHALGPLGFPQVWAFVRPDNAASIKVLEKIGMQPCGVLDDVPGQPPSRLFRATARDESGRP